MKRVAVLTNDLQYELVEKKEEKINSIIHLQLVNDPKDPNTERYDGYLKGAEIIEDFVEVSEHE